MEDGAAMRLYYIRSSIRRGLSNSNQPMGLAVSPDDVYVLWTQRDSDSRDLMLVDNFR